MLIDRALPRFDFTRVEHEVVEADPETTYAAVRRLDFLKVHSPLMDAAMWVRGVPNKIARATGRRTEPPQELPSLTFDGMVDGERGLPGWLKLWEVSLAGDRVRRDREVLADGRAGDRARPMPETPEAFTAFDDAGWGKIAANFSVRPYGDWTVVAELRGSDGDDRRTVAGD